MKWRAKRNADDQVIARCWVSNDGYTVAECRLPHKRYLVTRPGVSLPFAYADSRDEVVQVITTDMQASTAGN
ncbi:hypothetical protein [Pseudomonas sp. N2-11]|uniref:hypothetical protein n=1 Tax=Pseudomonas sp. N2-11 TaxID=2962038 RepID=UPI0020B7AB9F|nr:hypothetical protein [Pseudomonas sp. N2-11]MCP3788943.1 hypothetical protein [Pseudomonas sp. N2-11]